MEWNGQGGEGGGDGGKQEEWLMLNPTSHQLGKRENTFQTG